jgi:cytochrome c peroxidase
MNGRRGLLAAAVLVSSGLLTLQLAAGVFAHNLQPFPDPSGVIRTLSLRGAIDFSNPFFKKLGTNGRTCVAGFNDVRGQEIVVGTCGTCHNAPNVGSSSTPTMMDIGTSSPSPGILPAYTVRCNDSTQVVTTDLGRALVTGKCADISKVKMPSLRGLAARAPYFHNGSSATLQDVLNFYNQRFNMLLTADEKSDLVAFLNSL